jgi:hypothetical protein
MRPALLAELPPPRESRCVCFVAREEAYSLHGNGEREGGGAERERRRELVKAKTCWAPCETFSTLQTFLNPSSQPRPLFLPLSHKRCLPRGQPGPPEPAAERATATRRRTGQSCSAGRTSSPARGRSWTRRPRPRSSAGGATRATRTTRSSSTTVGGRATSARSWTGSRPRRRGPEEASSPPSPGGEGGDEKEREEKMKKK